MGQAERERLERIKRNEAMLRQVTGAAEDLASCVQATPPAEDRTARKLLLKERLATEAQQHGCRKSSRVASSAAAKRISKSLYDTDDEANAGESASASGSLQSESSSDDNDQSLPESPRSDDVRAENGNNHEAQPVSNQQQASAEADGNPLLSQEDRDMQLAIAISLAGDGRGEAAACAAGSELINEDGGNERGDSGGAAPRSAAAPAGAEKKKGGRKRKKRLDLSGAEVDAVFRYMSEGKVTVGRDEVVGVVNKLGLDVDDAGVDAAFEVLQESGCAGACGRVDGAGLRRLVKHLGDLY